VVLFSPVPLFGQHYSFRNYSIEDGLAQSQVYVIFQDSKGYLWIGTYGGGLNRYDGNTFANYSIKDGLSDNVIFSIIEDRGGNLWIGTDNGVNKYDGKSFIVYTEADGLPQNSIWTTLEDRDGYLWFATYSEGISRFDNTRNSFTNFSTAEGLIDDNVRALAQDSKGNLWIGTLKGISKYSGTGFTQCAVTESLKGYGVRCILEDRKGNLWFATNKGVRCFNGTTFTDYTTREGLCNDGTKFILEDSSGHIWISTENGVSQFDGRTFTTYTMKEGLSHYDVSSIIEDREGNLWFATESGVSKFSGKTFTYFSTKDGLKENAVWSIREDDDGTIWLGTEGGIAKYNEKASTIVTVPQTEAWSKGTTYPFYKDREGNVWFGTGEVLIKYDGRVYTNLCETHNLGKINVFSILEDSKGNMWVGTELNGVLKYDGKKFKHFKKEDGLVNETVNAIHEDYRGYFWLGTNEGISICDDRMKKITNITTAQWLTNRCVTTILSDRENNLWIAMYGGGVIKYIPAQTIGKGTVYTFNTNDGLVDDEALLMIFDDKNNLWIGSNKGIIRLDIAEFNRSGKKVFKHYGEEDGFIGIETNQNAVLKDSKGNLWFGTIRGAIKYDPKEDRLNTEEPAIHITGLKLFREEVDWSAYRGGQKTKREFGLPINLGLLYSQNHLTFEFIGISLTVPEKVRYKVKLEGFDNDWSPASKANFATYSNLPSGSYVFKVKACNNNGVWNKEPAAYAFAIRPPYWQTWWFYLLAIMAGIGIISGFFRLRVRQLKKRQRVLEEQIRLHTAEVKKEKANVEQINRELEQRVRERTRKLAIANKQLLISQKMKAVGTLAGGVAHDLNNILAGVVSYPELLLEELPEDSPLRSYILTIQRSGEKAAAIVEDLLALARRGITISETVNLNRVISEFLESPECEKIQSYHPNVRIGTRPDENLHNISGSAVHLSKAVMNLISNAAEAMPDGGTVIITTINQYIDRPIKGYNEIMEGDYVVLTVADTGIGISTEDISRIFEPFYTKKKLGKSGTGLGMSVVWGTVADHHGYIAVESTENKGTTFTLYFPAAAHRESVEDKSQISANDYMGSGESILVVDDVEEQQGAASLMLTRLGYSVQAVSSGEAALDYLKNHSADLVVLDMIMDPGMDGLETYKQILQLHPKQKAVIISGYSETEAVKETQKLGAGVYIKKPFRMKEIGMAVKNELEGGRRK